jgi:hypothetical protein
MANGFDMINPQMLRATGIKSMLEGEEDIYTYLSRMINLSEEGVFHDQSCPICKSLTRSAAEKEWSGSRNAEVVRQIFLDKGEKYTIPIIKHHMENHFGSSGTELRKQEYIHRLSILGNAEMSTLAKLELTLTALNERLVAINAMQDAELPDSTVEKIKADSTCKIIAQMEKLLRFRADMLGEMRVNGEVFTVDKKEFVNLFADVLAEATTQNEKAIVNKIFARIQAICREY